ncbi:inhibitor of KinA [Bacillus fengqiuensis]|nr:inhibitor of KinA [Bacillus fengqiuensis]
MSNTISGVKTTMEMKPLGDSAILVQFGSEMNEETHLKVKALTAHLDAHPFDGLIECVPAFTSVTIFYHPLRIRQMYKERMKSMFGLEKEASPYQIVRSIVEELAAGLEQTTEAKRRIVEIPVCYGGELGPDLEAVAEYHGLSTSDVIDIHSQADYLVYMIGFAPGFPYLGGMSEKIATPRHSSPRLSIAAGSVGIAGKQTGVYPISTPGGWQIIGRTPIDLFQPEQNPPTLLQAGDIVQFKPISLEEYKSYKEKTI